MSLSLEHLVDATDKSDFVIIRKEFKDKTGILITKRGYPYKYLDRNSTKQNDHQSESLIAVSQTKAFYKMAMNMLKSSEKLGY